MGDGFPWRPHLAAIATGTWDENGGRERLMNLVRELDWCQHRSETHVNLPVFFPWAPPEVKSARSSGNWRQGIGELLADDASRGVLPIRPR